MYFDLKDISNANAQALFAIGDTVKIKIYDKDGTDVTPASPDDECTPYGELDTFQWSYSNLSSIPTVYQEYTWIMYNSSGIKQRDVDVFSTGAGYFFHIPFDIDITSENINKGDAFEFDFRVETNVDGLKIIVAFEDGETTDSVIIYKKTANLSGGGDDQIQRIAGPDFGFQIFRVYLSGDETELFTATRFMDMKTTVEAPDGKTQTIKKKIPFTQVSAIDFDTVP
jgi:hypothetical protein